MVIFDLTSDLDYVVRTQDQNKKILRRVADINFDSMNMGGVSIEHHQCKQKTTMKQVLLGDLTCFLTACLYEHVLRSSVGAT